MNIAKMIKILYTEEEINEAKRLVQHVYTTTTQPPFQQVFSGSITDSCEGSFWIGYIDSGRIVGTCRITTKNHDVIHILKHFKQDKIIQNLPERFYECGRIVVAESHRGTDVYNHLSIRAMEICKSMDVPFVYKSAVKRMIHEGNDTGYNAGHFFMGDFMISVFVCDPKISIPYLEKRLSKL